MMKASKIEKKMISAQMQSTEMSSKDYRESGGIFTIMTHQQQEGYVGGALGVVDAWKANYSITVVTKQFLGSFHPLWCEWFQ